MDNRKKTRRMFIKTAGRALAGMLIGVAIAKPSLAQRIHEIEKGQDLPDWMDHYWVYLIDTTKCIGCGACVRADKRENKVPPRFFRTWVERYQITEDKHVHVDSPNGGLDGFLDEDIIAYYKIPHPDAHGMIQDPPSHKIKGRVTKAFFVPKMCNHCRNTPCTQVCPVNASYQSPDGVVLVDKKRCIGCAYCVQACPYGSRYIHPETHTADKCTWCYHRITKGLLPACVTVCPTGARKFGDLKEATSEIKELLATMRLNVLKPELNTEPFCFYIGLEQSVR
ncbi:MAG: 4Fe-4S dicluster domain-containing protein [Nitrospinota bacterium]|nr:4Fe-4S dicluster domain-containing protein [Nitrospinota bacterium]